MKSLKEKFIQLRPEERLHTLAVPVIGLTGGIASGKSTVSKLLLKNGIPLIDADQLVKNIYEQAETRDFIKQQHPEAWKVNQVHFPTLREKFFKNPEAKVVIEKFIYERLPAAFQSAYQSLGNPPFVVYDVPLLFEKKLEQKVDLKVLVYAPRKIQLARIIDRDGHKQELAETILSHQMDIEEKKNKSDFIIDNSRSLKELAVEVESFLRQVLV